MIRHTPGPWVVDWQGPDQPIYSGNVCVATAWAGAGSGPNDETADNASLIAAAPDLLAALRGMLDAYGNCGTPHQQAAADAAKAAIKMATGGAS